MSRQSHRQFSDFDEVSFHPESDAPPSLHVVSADCNGCAAADLARERRIFAATFHNAPVGIAHVSLDGRFLLVNPRFCEISGYDADTLIRTGFRQITHPDDRQTDESLLARLNAGEFNRYAVEKRYVRADGSVIWVSLTVAMVRDDDGQPEFYVGVIEDVSDLRKASFEAIHDPLTGLLNRRGFASRARDALRDAAEADERVSLLFLDLDGFKRLNDEQGHAVGDICLTDVGQILRNEAEPGDVVARVGGDEFLWLTRNGGGIAMMAERARAALAAYGSGVSGSFGLVTAETPDPADLDRLIACADDAMRAAKRNGKNCVQIAAFL